MKNINLLKLNHKKKQINRAKIISEKIFLLLAILFIEKSFTKINIELLKKLQTSKEKPLIL